MEWHDREPIFRQLAETIRQQIVDDVWQEGAALPSVRKVATDLKINHLTVMKSYQLLVDECLVEKRRGQGMFVLSGSKSRLLKLKKEAFIREELPQIAHTLEQIDMGLPEFIEQLKQALEARQL
ncbi:GntR family transcriptional regulator [Vibrio nitrifigilis]|uniref:GntR family transcriptional regulator n=1 Tax=Vibrio nitrifigilis TaxID=2789781 RepID=A0ABS0GMI3_9VIBR|nr:GntR family transcriptional regulator [Vibrio nitrifigilis]MBF9003454.1 GntR family transcriptional regulator [Vibrio nitrifigilis]